VRTGSFKGVLLSTIVIASIIGLAMPLLSPSPVHAALTSHAPIYINDNSQFTSANGVTSGSGTENDPYIIQNWDISAGNAPCIEIRNTTAYFIIRNCYVHDGGSNYVGIYFYNVTKGVIDNTITENNQVGICLESSDNNLVSNNLARNNYYEGIHLYNFSNNTTLNYNTCENNIIGISLSYSSNNTISNNTCENNSILGIFLYISNNNLIDNNICEKKEEIGIHLENSLNNTISNNVTKESVYGIYLENSDNNLVSNNIARNNSYDGIDLYYSDNNLVSNNICKNNVRDGISHLYSENNTLVNNTFKSNGYGIYVRYSNNNRIYHNNFINNAIQAYDYGSNYWDNGYPSGGNYWSDYTGEDENHGANQDIPGGDGIGDTPYYISGDTNRDRYPIMSSFPFRDVGIEISPSYQDVPAKTVLTYTVTVTNPGTENDNYDLTVSDNTGWGPTLLNNLLEVPAAENRQTILNVTIPENATPCTEDSIMVVATSRANNMVRDTGTCVAHVFSPKAGFKLENLYKVGLDMNLWPENGSKLVVKFYKYDSTYQAENVIENFAPPKHIENIENIPHPSGLPVEIVRLVLTTDDTANEISTIASFTATKSVLFGRYGKIKTEYSKTGADKPALFKEYSDIKKQYAKAP